MVAPQPVTKIDVKDTPERVGTTGLMDLTVVQTKNGAIMIAAAITTAARITIMAAIAMVCTITMAPTGVLVTIVKMTATTVT